MGGEWNRRLWRTRATGVRLHLGTGFAVAFLVMLFSLSPPGVMLETTLGLPLLYAWRGPLPPPPRTVLVKLDDWSASGLGPAVSVDRWPRELHACLIRRLTDAGAALVVLDIHFNAQPATPPADFTLPAGCPGHRGGGTQQLREEIRRAGNVLLASHLGSSAAPGNGAADALRWEELPAAAVADGALGTSPFPLSAEQDQVTQFWSFFHFGEREIPTLATLAAHAASLPAKGPPGTLRPRLEALRRQLREVGPASAASGGERILAADPVHYLNVYGPPGWFTSLDYAQVLDAAQRDRLAAEVAGATVFVGAAEHRTNTTLDTWRTGYPVDGGARYGGVELVATAYANLVEDSALRPLAGWQHALLILALAGVVFAATWWCELALVAGVAVATALAYATVAHLAFSHWGLWLPLATPVGVAVPAFALGATALHYRQARRLWSRLLDVASRYVSTQALARHFDGRVPGPATELAFGVILASDAQHFARLIERVGGDPRRLVPRLNDYYAAITRPIADVSPPGTVLDIAGDGMFALWQGDGAAPSLAATRPARLAACQAALEIVAAVDRDNRHHADMPLPTRVGLHAGSVAVGDLQAHGRQFYKAVGDVSNTASRVEGLNKVLGTRLLATAAVVEGLEDALLLRPCGRYRLPGKTVAQQVFEVMALHEDGNADQRALCERFGAALDALARGDGAPAFAELKAAHPDDGPTAVLHAAATGQGLPLAEDDDGAVIVIESK